MLSYTKSVVPENAVTDDIFGAVSLSGTQRNNCLCSPHNNNDYFTVLLLTSRRNAPCKFTTNTYYTIIDCFLLFFFVRTRRSFILIIKNTVFCLFAFFFNKTLYFVRSKQKTERVLHHSCFAFRIIIINSLNPRNVCTPSSTCTGCTTVPCGPCRTPCGTSCSRRVGDAATPASWGCAALATVWGVCGATGGWWWGRRRRSDGRSRQFGAGSRGPRAGDGPCRGATGLAGDWFRPSPSRCSRILPRPRLYHLCLWNNKHTIWK